MKGDVYGRAPECETHKPNDHDHGDRQTPLMEHKHKQFGISSEQLSPNSMVL